MKLEHGFTTREEWAALFNQYYLSIKNINKLSYELIHEQNDLERWVLTYKKCSDLERSMYLSHDKDLQTHIRYFTEDGSRLTKDIADALLSYLFRYVTRMEDTDISYTITCTLLAYYEKEADEIALMKCNAILTICYIYLDTEHFRSRGLKCMNIARKYFEKHYHELSPEDKSLGLSIYDHASCLIFEESMDRPDFTEYFDKVLIPLLNHGVYWFHIFMKEADMSLEVNQVLPFMLQNYMNVFTIMILGLKKGQLKKRQAKIIYDMARKALLDTKQNPDANIYEIRKWELTFLISEYHYKDLDPDMVMEQVLKIEQDISDSRNERKQDLDKIELDLLLSICTVIHMLFSEISIPVPIERILEKVIDHIAFLPYGIFTDYMIGHTIYSCITPFLSLVEDDKAIIRYFINVLMLRQPQTVVHTYMVAECSEAIIRYLAAERPDMLIGLLHCSSPEEVRAHKKDFLEYIHHASLLHDVGKVLCTSVINTQFRKISNLEFEAIQFHPVTGKAILDQIPSLKKYSDIAAGHHKSADGTIGYPQSFDIQSSEYRLFIDIISISDSLDAATDGYGRSYAMPKTFETVLEEMKNDRRRYNAEIITFIEECQELKQTLSDIILFKRTDIYENVYNLLKEKQEHKLSVWLNPDEN